MYKQLVWVWSQKDNYWRVAYFISKQYEIEYGHVVIKATDVHPAHWKDGVPNVQTYDEYSDNIDTLEENLK